jgi:valyl-tRNA synthetase
LNDHTLKIDLNNQIDVEKEIERLNKQLNKHQHEQMTLIEKMANPSFKQHAPHDLIEQNQSRIQELESLIEKSQKYIRILG